MDASAALLGFWFEESRPADWFRSSPERDRTLRDRFGALTEQALRGELAAWAGTPAGALALVLLLDQFPRQIWRDQPRAFAGDPQALALSLRALELGWVAAEADPDRRRFWLMPLMHSEDLAVQKRAVPLFEQFGDPRSTDFARRHRDVIARFGRFPHRNRILGRPDRPEETVFLQQPGSRF
jgi:uncharacterized protein (DUF924 family)